MIGVFLNFFTWIYNPTLLKIEYKYKETNCSQHIAIDAKLKPSFSQGYFFQFLETRNLINCYVEPDILIGQKIIKGFRLAP